MLRRLLDQMQLVLRISSPNFSKTQLHDITMQSTVSFLTCMELETSQSNTLVLQTQLSYAVTMFLLVPVTRHSETTQPHGRAPKVISFSYSAARSIGTRRSKRQSRPRVPKQSYWLYLTQLRNLCGGSVCSKAFNWIPGTFQPLPATTNRRSVY
jgi:hypothetical protein